MPLTGATLTLFMLLTAAFGLVLLIACANAANMLPARGLRRQRELGIRVSLGASRCRLIRQLLIESSVLAVPAAGVALLCTFATAWGFPRLVTSTLPAGAEVISQILAPFDPDMRVLTVLWSRDGSPRCSPAESGDAGHAHEPCRRHARADRIGRARLAAT